LSFPKWMAETQFVNFSNWNKLASEMIFSDPTIRAHIFSEQWYSQIQENKRKSLLPHGVDFYCKK
jgi:hypothetical protein